MPDLDRTALVVVDVQKGFDDPVWGQRNNPACEANVELLIDEWGRRGRPIVFVRHDSNLPDSPLHPRSPGNDFKPQVHGTPDLLVTKSVNSAFLGTPDLHAWLGAEKITGLAITGIQTNMCVETTARVAGNLGYDTLLVMDATHTFDLPALDGQMIGADELARVTAANLEGEFAHIVSTHELIGDREAGAA